MTRAARTISLTAALAVALGGCIAGPSRPTTVAVSVRESITNAPVPDVVLRARPLQLYVPTWPFGQLGGDPGAASVARTGPDGTADLAVPGGLPFELEVVPPGRAPTGLTVQPDEPVTWQPLPVVDADDAPLEISVAPR